MDNVILTPSMTGINLVQKFHWKSCFSRDMEPLPPPPLPLGHQPVVKSLGHLIVNKWILLDQ